MRTGACPTDSGYTYWDVGLDFNYKAVTLDLRYWDTDKHRMRSSPRLLLAQRTWRLDLCRDPQVRHLVLGA